MSKEISNAMKKFWSEKTDLEKEQINLKRSISNSKCIYIIKPEQQKAQACNIDNLIDYLSLGYKICNTDKNRSKLKDFEFPNDFFI